MRRLTVLLMGLALLTGCGRDKDADEDDKIKIGDLRAFTSAESTNLVAVCQAFQDKQINVANNETYEFDLDSTPCGGNKQPTVIIRKTVKRSGNNISWSSPYGGNFFNVFETHQNGELRQVCTDLFAGGSRNNYDMIGNLQAKQYAVVKNSDSSYDVIVFSLQRVNAGAQWSLNSQYAFRVYASGGGVRTGFIKQYARSVSCGGGQFDSLTEKFKRKI